MFQLTKLCEDVGLKKSDYSYNKQIGLLDIFVNMAPLQPVKSFKHCVNMTEVAKPTSFLGH